MRKQISKRRTWARFMLGKWVPEYLMIKYDLDARTGSLGLDVEFDVLSQVRRLVPHVHATVP